MVIDVRPGFHTNQNGRRLVQLCSRPVADLVGDTSRTYGNPLSGSDADIVVSLWKYASTQHEMSVLSFRKKINKTKLDV